MNVLTRIAHASVRALLLGATILTAASADQLQPADRELFERHVRPVLVTHCIKCHGQTKQENGLVLTSLEAMVRGGDSGPAVVPGRPDESLLLEALQYESLEMPPAGPLHKNQIEGIKAWIEAQAPWPDGVVLQPQSSETTADRDWWCYQPVVDFAVPEVKDGGWCRNDIDRFIFARMTAAGIEPSDEATRPTLARRLHFAVTGLPPDETAMRFINGEEDYETLVERLLNNPAHGENQARSWLDLVRYADSDGYRADHERPLAQLYRDYVIRSFNADKPYDQFVAEQLAGDEIDPGNRDALIGTMFLRHWIYEFNQRDVERQWREILDDITETTADVFLAQGIKCARCHDHKFDPIAQQDYFRIRAFFAAVHPKEDMPVASLEEQTAFHIQHNKWLKATDEIRRQIHDIETPVLLQHSTNQGVDKFVTEIKSMMLSREVDRSPYEHQIASLALRQLDLHPDKLPEQLDKVTEAKRQSLRKQLAEFDSLKPDPLPTLAFVAGDVGRVAPATFIPDDPHRTPIEPGFLSVFGQEPAPITAPPEVLQSTGRRTALARWIANPANPLTARVIVNRIWQQHFGRGLVETTSDFGHLGNPPSHPQLLDWLTGRFIDDGWSLRSLHRRILTSATWRQTSQRTPNNQLAQYDPENRLLWRMNARRLSGEEIVDTMLLVSGELPSQKRAIYKPVMRNQRDPLLMLFDFPDRIRTTGQRHRTTTSPQALMLMNNPWTHDRAAAMTKRLRAVAKAPEDDSAAAFIRTAFRQLYFRDPDADEIASANQFMASYAGGDSAVSDSKTPALDSHTALLHALINSNELIYVD